MSEEKPTYDIGEARRIFDADRQARAEQAVERIQAVLIELRCELRAVIGVGGQAVAVPVQIVAT